MSRQRKASVSETLQANALRRAVTRVRANSIAKQSLSKAVLPSALIQLPQTLTENHHDFTTLDVKLEQRLVKESPERLNRTPLMNVRHLNRFLKILIMHYKAILLNDSANIHKLLESDENKINDTDSLECNALHYALLVDSIETFKHLLAKGANLNQKDSTGQYLLHHCAKLGNIKLGKVLLEEGMDVNLRDSLQRTPLFIAIKELKTSFVELLFEYRTDIDAVDAKEQCCIDYFDFENFDAVLWDLLQSKLQVKFSIDNVGELTGQEILIFGNLMESVPDLRASEFEEEIDEDAFEEIVSPTTTQFESLNLIESTEFSKNCNSIKEEDESELTESRHSLNQTTHVHQQYNYDIDDIIQFPSSMDQLLTITESKIMNDSSSELHKILDQVDALKKQISNIQSELDISKQLQMDQNAHHSNDLINLRQLFDASTAQQLLDFQILSKQKADNTAPLLLQLNEILDTIVSKAQIQHLQKESTRVASELLLLEGNIGQDNKCMDEIVKEMNTASRVLKSSPFHRAYDESDSLSSLYGAHLRALNVLITCWKENIERIGDIEGDVSSNGSVSTPVEENEIDYNQSSQNESYYSSKNDKEKITMSAPGIERSLLKEAAV